jgi:alpha-glucosidase (family GH31 glycosyl hydrolase)
MRNRLVAAIACLASAVALVVTAPAVQARADGDASAGWRATDAPFSLTFLDHGRPVTAEAGGTTAGPGGRLAYQVGGPDAGTEPAYHRLTDLLDQRSVEHGTEYTVATDEPGRTATVTVTSTPQGVRVRWALTPATGVTAMFEALSAGATEHYLSGSSAAYVDLRGHIRGWSPGKEGNEAGDYCQNQEQSASPFYLSSGGYGLYADTDHVGRFAFPDAAPVADGPNCARTPRVASGTAQPQPCPVSSTAYPDRVQVCVKGGAFAYDVYAGSPSSVTTAYYRTVGLPSLPPPSQFGLMKWRDVNADQQQVLDDVAQMKNLGVPLGTIWIDNPWEQQPPGYLNRRNGTACNGSLRFDPTFFPDPKGMIDRIHAQGVMFGLWTSPITSTPSGQSCAGINDVWSKNGWLIPGTNYIDFTIPAARAYYVDHLTQLFRLGVDMTKEDRGEEFRLETAQLAGGPGASEYLRYASRYQSAVSEALRNANGDDFETLVRAGVPGTAQHTHGMWGSDTFQTFAGLRTELRYGISESLTGHFAWGSDTGGIDPQSPANATNSPTPSLFTRWSQFSAISPVFEVGGAGLNATPWAYDADTVRRFRDAVILHYELFPYLYGLAARASGTGVPILRALGYQFPGDPRAWAQDQELMVGPDLLAAPVTADRAETDGAAGRPTPVDVYLPEGRWVDVYTGQVVDGGRTVTRETSLDEFPLYLRAGATIGFNARVPGVWQDGWGTNDLTTPGLSGWLYAPTGTSTHVRVPSTTARTQLLVLTSHTPRTVRVDDRALPHAVTPSALGDMASGWAYRSGRFGGVVVKLPPRQGDAAPADVQLG